MPGMRAAMDDQNAAQEDPCPECNGTGLIEGPPPTWGYNEYFTISCSCRHHESCVCSGCEKRRAAQRIREPVEEDQLTDDGSRWQIAFSDGMVAEVMRVKGERWEARITAPYRAHLRQQFLEVEDAVGFLCTDHLV
jgi:hypothetical protein